MRTRYIVGRVIPVRCGAGDEEGNRQDAKSAKENRSTDGTDSTDRAPCRKGMALGEGNGSTDGTDSTGRAPCRPFDGLRAYGEGLLTGSRPAAIGEPKAIAEGTELAEVGKVRERSGQGVAGE